MAKSYPVAAEVDGAGSATTSSFYVDYVSRDLGKIVELVVPEGRQGLPNLLSTKQVLFSPSSIFHFLSFLVVDDAVIDFGELAEQTGD